MKSIKMLTILVLAFGLILCQAKVSKATPMGTAWTYQGRLMDNNEPADGRYDLQFALFTDPILSSSRIGPTVYINDLDVIDGYFTVGLDFGNKAFTGDARWLEIGVRPWDSEERYTILSPRREVTPTPYALYAQNANTDNDWMVSGSDMYSIPSGKVGVGTTAPRASLEVTNTGTSHAIWASTSDIPVYAHRTSTGGTWPAVAGDCNSQASNASGVRGRILSTSPGSLGAGVYGYNYGIGSNGVGVRGHHAGNGYAGYFTGGKNYFEGNVGIGTTNPSEKLDVEGNIDVSSNRVKNYKGFPRPDYDSGWVSIAQNQSLQFLHNIGGDPDDYVVDVQGKDLEGMGVNIHGLGGYVDTGATYIDREGFYWHNLTSSYIRVLRLKENTSADQVRVRIWVYN